MHSKTICFIDMSTIDSNYHYPIFSPLISVAYRAKSKVEQFAQYLFSQIAAIGQILLTRTAARFALISMGLAGSIYIFVHSSPQIKRIGALLLFVIGLVALSRLVFQATYQAEKIKGTAAFNQAYEHYKKTWEVQKHEIDELNSARIQLANDIVVKLKEGKEKLKIISKKEMMQLDHEKRIEYVIETVTETNRMEKLLKYTASIRDRMDQHLIDFKEYPDLTENSYTTEEIIKIQRLREEHHSRAMEAAQTLLNDGYGVLNQFSTNLG